MRCVMPSSPDAIGSGRWNIDDDDAEEEEEDEEEEDEEGESEK